MSESWGQVNTFSYTEEILDELATSLSLERIGTYLMETKGDREKAARLYTWNIAVSAAFYGALQGLEVTLRNAMHTQLAAQYGSAWYDNPAAGLDRGGLERIANVKARLRADRYAVDAPRIVASLSFGFWISLLGPGGRIGDTPRKANYEMTLWRPALRKAFPHRRPLTRKQVHGPLRSLQTLRNRIAHHEPIFARNLTKDHQCILDVTGWISPETQVWIAHHSRVPVLLGVPRDVAGIGF